MNPLFYPYALWDMRTGEFLGEYSAAAMGVMIYDHGQTVPLGAFWIEPSWGRIEGPPGSSVVVVVMTSLDAPGW
jgi:hypothetical protein